MGTFADMDDCAYRAMRRDTGQLSLNFMTMIHAAAGSSVYFLSTNTGHRETENKLYTGIQNTSFSSSSCCRYDSDIKVKAVCGSYSTAALGHIVLLPE